MQKNLPWILTALDLKTFDMGDTLFTFRSQSLHDWKFESILRMVIRHLVIIIVSPPILSGKVGLTL
jgi:hypothetical protein